MCSLLQCWESFVGQYVYSLFIIVMLIEIATNIFQPPLQRLLHKHVQWTRQVMEKC